MNMQCRVLFNLDMDYFFHDLVGWLDEHASCNTCETISVSLQAPVSGSKKPAEDGQLIFLTAGEYSSSITITY